MGSGHRTIREVGPAALLELADHRVSLRLAIAARQAVHEGAEAPESSRRRKDLGLMRITPVSARLAERWRGRSLERGAGGAADTSGPSGPGCGGVRGGRVGLERTVLGGELAVPCTRKPL
jgi:hypothetical protein